MGSAGQGVAARRRPRRLVAALLESAGLWVQVPRGLHAAGVRQGTAPLARRPRRPTRSPGVPAADLADILAADDTVASPR
jgi:hypothetical protein